MLFPAFEKTMGEVTGPTVVRRAEHVEIRRRLDHAATMLAERDQAAAKKAADALTDVLSMHNMKEEAILYPMTDRWLGGERERVELVRRMQAL